MTNYTELLANPIQPILTRRNVLILGALFVCLSALAIELVVILPRVLAEWHPYDYNLYLEMGRSARQGVNPIGPRHYYPLPTVLWIFAPLSLLPDWFRLVWLIAPIFFILTLFGRRGLLLLAFTPLWYASSDAMVDGWLLLPMLWLLENRAGWAGIGAVALLMKPQIAILTIIFALARWVWTRDWRNLGAFAGALTLFCLPAFIFDPEWMQRMLAVLPQRANESTALLPLLSSSLWSWWSLGLWGQIVLIALVAVSVILFIRAWRADDRRLVAFQCLNLLFVPVLFMANSITLAPALSRRNELFVLVAVSLIAFALDLAAHGFGGVYVFIPLTVLYFAGRGTVSMTEARLG